MKIIKCPKCKNNYKQYIVNGNNFTCMLCGELFNVSNIVILEDKTLHVHEIIGDKNDENK